MHVVVGSGNPVKRRATESVVPGEWTVATRSVPSGVSEQPTGHAETVEGASNRARRAFAEPTADLGIGIEGGVADFDGVPGRYLVMWAAATDGERLTRASGPAFPLPDAIADRIDAGEELGPVMDDVLGTTDVARQQGAAGAFTGGAVDRTSALGQAVAGALGPFLTDLY